MSEGIGLTKLSAELDSVIEKWWFLWSMEINERNKAEVILPIEAYLDNPSRHERKVSTSEEGDDPGMILDFPTLP